MKQGENPFMWQTYDEEIQAAENIIGSIWWLAKTFARHLWFIVKTTVPLMLLAGFLGALVISLLPWNTLAEILPTEGIFYVGLGMLAAAVIGLFLPCPITFDIVIAAVLFAAGTPPYYVMVLLFTLGIFSVYSFSIVWTGISKKVAVVLSTALVLLGVIAGFAAAGGDWYQKKKLEELALTVLATTPPPPRVPGPQVATEEQIFKAIQGELIVPQPLDLAVPEGIVVHRITWNANASQGGDGGFNRRDGKQLGVFDTSQPVALRAIVPGVMGRALATGDVHNDGWPDLVLAENRSVGGLTLYANMAGKKFVAQRINIPQLSNLIVMSIGLVDINNDGWLDIFFSTHLDGNYLLFNRRGVFDEKSALRVPSVKNTSAIALSFGDIERDGDLDVLVGNWTMGDLSRQTPASKNIILANLSPKFKAINLDEMIGETLTTLLSDMNGDGWLDVFIGNDFGVPDYYYLGLGKGELKKLTVEDKVVPHSTTTTMTIAVADIDNDLASEIYVGAIARGVGVEFADQLVDDTNECMEFTDEKEKRVCERTLTEYRKVNNSARRRDVSLCMDLKQKDWQADCVGINVLWAQSTAKKVGGFNPAVCNFIPQARRSLFAMCHELARPIVQNPESEFKSAIPQIESHNVLLIPNGNNGYDDKAKERGVALGGWSWNAKFADIDNDGWKDLYIANGFFQSRNRESNIFYRNKQDGSFENETERFGLGDFRATGSYSYVDFDNDGDLDIITVPVYGNVQFYVNNGNGNKAIAFELRDRKGNRFGIGSKVIIHYGEGAAKRQMVEIQAGGGFLSFDAPIAHFGLGEHEKVDKVDIHWSTGERMTVDGPFEAGARYLLTRG